MNEVTDSMSTTREATGEPRTEAVERKRIAVVFGAAAIVFAAVAASIAVNHIETVQGVALAVLVFGEGLVSAWFGARAGWYWPGQPR